MPNSKLVRIAIGVLIALALMGADTYLLRLRAKLGNGGVNAAPLVATTPPGLNGCALPFELPCEL